MLRNIMKFEIFDFRFRSSELQKNFIKKNYKGVYNEKINKGREA